MGFSEVSEIDKVVFGDNQFFGINHMSQERAQELTERFHDMDSIFAVYNSAFEAGIRAVMLNSNDRASEICDRFRARASSFPELNWYPSIPYPHKYANLVAEKGIIGALHNCLFQHGSAISGLGKLTQGGLAMISMDLIKLMKILVDTEMYMFRSLNVKAVFLQNIVTDLLIGLDIEPIFAEYCEHIRKKYKAMPGLITQNMPVLHEKLKAWGISEVVICTSINRIGYLMSPSIASYESTLAHNDPRRYPIMAMSTLASGALRAPEAYSYINSLNIQSVVFGASSKAHIEETQRLIKSR
jgi:hypothetical protein